MERLLTLWKFSFPLSADEAKEELKKRGDSFTWTATLEARAGVLASMDAFLRCCPELATDEIVFKMVLPIETCLITMGKVEFLMEKGVRLR